MNGLLFGLFLGITTGYIYKMFFGAKENLWKDRHVLITGGSTGLGRAFAVRVAKEGARVTLVARNQEKLEDAVTYVKEQQDGSSKVQWISFDVTVRDKRKWELLVTEAAADDYGTPDCIVACAGSAAPALILDAPIEDFEQQSDLNYLGVVRTIKAFLPSMTNEKKKKAYRRRIIVVSSAAGLASIPGYAAYAGSKYALRGFCDALRPEMLAHDVDVHMFYPSSIDTPGYAEENLTKPDVTKEIEGSVSLWTPEEAANHLYDGVAKGQYHIVSEFLIDIVRSTSNGITPRNHPLLELMVLPLMPAVEWFYRTCVIESAVMADAKNKKKRLA